MVNGFLNAKNLLILFCNFLVKALMCNGNFRLLYKWYNTIKIKTGLSKDDDEESKASGSNQWCADYRLLDWGPRGLFPEYLEMGTLSRHTSLLVIYNFLEI